MLWFGLKSRVEDIERDHQYRMDELAKTQMVPCGVCYKYAPRCTLVVQNSSMQGGHGETIEKTIIAHPECCSAEVFERRVASEKTTKKKGTGK